jgi:glycosyltransferase 2 family protein
VISTPASRRATNRKKLPVIWFFRVAVSVLVLVMLFRIVPIEQVWADMRRLPPVLWLSALALFLAGHAAAAAKWRLLIGTGVSFPQAFQAHLAGLAANLCLPGLAGGDIVRAGLVYPRAHDASQLVMGSLADRLLDILGLVILAAAGALLAWPGDQGGERRMLGWLLGGAVLVVMLVPASLMIDKVVQRAHPSNRAARLVARAISATAHLARKPARLALCLAISLAVQATFVGINIALAAAVDLHAPTAAWFFAWSTAKIVAIAPISLGGLGVREAMMASLLAPFGAEPAQVIAIGLIWQTILYASGLIGALAQFVWKPDLDNGRPGISAEAVERSS